MNNKLKVGLVGVGKRQRTVYMPILNKLEDFFDVVGVTNRTDENGQKFAKDFDLDYYGSYKELISSANPDCLIVCVHHSAILSVLENILPFERPILIETPVESRDVVNLCMNSNTPVSVAEQWPYLPLEQFKQEIFKQDKMKRPMLVMNDGRSFDYHAIAQLRSYIGRDLYPVVATGQSVCVGSMIDFKDNDGKESMMNDNWDLANVKFNNGSVISHQFSYVCKKAPFRTIQSLRSYSSDGTIMTGKIDDKDNDYEIIDIRVLDDRDKETKKMKPDIDRSENGTVRKIYDPVTGVLWMNEFYEYELNDFEVAIAKHLSSLIDVCINNSAPLYSVKDAFFDFLIMSAIKQACYTSSSVKFS